MEAVAFSFFTEDALDDVGVPAAFDFVGDEETRRVETLLSAAEHDAAALHVGQNHVLDDGTDDNGGVKQNVWYSSSH